MTNFSDFGLARPIMLALDDEGHATPTPIQAGSIPPLMTGSDLLGVAQTGTGKTAAFALPILHRLANAPQAARRGECRVLVLAPTRELAAQVQSRFNAYGKQLRLRTGLVIGGASIHKQIAMTRAGVDVLVATPGRLVDIINQGALSLAGVETFVLDEVDQMLDLGFIHAIRAIAAQLPSKRQNVFFSATMPPAIEKLANALLRDPVRVEIRAVNKLKIDESVIFIEPAAKAGELLNIVKQDSFKRGLVFTRTKHGADKVVRTLNAAGAHAFAIHGNRSQSQREKALGAFRTGKSRILVATDIAARGLDISEVSHVINYDLPNVPETYVHRIGRTARAGAAGVAISFCSNEERSYLKSVEKLTRQRIAVAKRENRAPSPDRQAVQGEAQPRQNGDRHFNAAPFLKDQAAPASRGPRKPNQQKKEADDERGTARIRRRRNRGPAGRKLSRRAG